MEMQKYLDDLKVEGEPHVKALAKALVLKLMVPVLKDAVAKSETKVDDIVLASLLGTAEQALLAAIDAVKL